jgi:hypothetical protein
MAPKKDTSQVPDDIKDRGHNRLETGKERLREGRDQRLCSMIHMEQKYGKRKI